MAGVELILASMGLITGQGTNTMLVVFAPCGDSLRLKSETNRHIV